MTANEEIISFLHECINHEWDLDTDDIKHILDLDFDYVRDVNTPAKCPKCDKELEFDDLRIRSDLCKVCFEKTK